MRRLKDTRNGEIYGYNPEMAKLPHMQEFDDEAADPDGVITQPMENSAHIGPTGVANTADEAVALAIAKARAEGEAQLTADSKSEDIPRLADGSPDFDNMTPEQIQAELERAEAAAAEAEEGAANEPEAEAQTEAAPEVNEAAAAEETTGDAAPAPAPVTVPVTRRRK
jgi:hypothetical protein